MERTRPDLPNSTAPVGIDFKAGFAGWKICSLLYGQLLMQITVDLAYQLDNIVQKEKATERLFHVDINGIRVLSLLDVAEEVGVRINDL